MAVKKKEVKKAVKKVAKKVPANKGKTQVHIKATNARGLGGKGVTVSLDHFTPRAIPSKAETLKTDNVMTQAQEVIYGDREKTYGHPSLNLETIAQMWNVYIHRKATVELAKNPFAHAEDLELVDTIVPSLTVDDICQMMVMLKMARLLNDPSHHDSMVDQVGYIGLQERVQGS